MQWPSISVIVPTYQREDVLCSTIADVLKQDYPDFEVLVVDQTRDHQPATQHYLQETSEGGQIQWLQVDWASLPAARNYGIERSRGDIILFIDDDVELPAGYLKAHAQILVSKPEVGAVAGRVFDRMKLGDNPDLSIDYLPEEAMDPGIAWYYIDLVHTTQPQQVITARGCNMSFRRDIFGKHGLRFDERFRGNAVREESDFCLQIRQTGYIVWYAPEANLIHLGEETGGCHDISTRSLSYQITFYHNHFLMGLKNLSFGQAMRLYARLFDCHVLGHPPCNKSGSPLKIITRFSFYCLGFLDATRTLAQTGKRHRVYTHPTDTPMSLSAQC
ncbi:hormogonium polysaccharide biosynthesis glycosyltransferase HpsN [Oscillatoria sp. CS-180]|uniref:hormogonium polysaccharide biosynthesis glycosyltransferase HpsN n=1 Tax=Oscillatoria sp. CS-180 TaxID=3021720 RepID=UPI00232DF27C|nr:hormogonium polysaccharide biosynthesis glycosyltransferase HpsN [Oscillatoria sp. CS-180]MDB9524441.1 hormogonium polysaccharide biosynthesis glycosyltransferase HpsN [Oscillatoria sp. CS-180]